jgi:hypothetical protein
MKQALAHRGNMGWGVCDAHEGEPMGYILAIMSVPFLSATGIYKPDVMKHGRCIAEPGSYQALYCPAPQTPANPTRRKSR